MAQRKDVQGARAELPELLSTAQLAEHFLNVSERVAQDILKQPWAPRPIVLGPRLVRHYRSAWIAAISAMPRERINEPAQLALSRAKRSTPEIA